MTIDSSALVAILRNEPEAAAFSSALVEARIRIVSAATILETSMVLDGRAESPQLYLDEYLRKINVSIRPFDDEQLASARIAFRRFGKGRHPAALNFGDCISYALSQTSGEPLLFKGDDFRLTDVIPAL